MQMERSCVSDRLSFGRTLGRFWRRCSAGGQKTLQGATTLTLRRHGKKTKKEKNSLGEENRSVSWHLLLLDIDFNVGQQSAAASWRATCFCAPASILVWLNSLNVPTRQDSTTLNLLTIPRNIYIYQKSHCCVTAQTDRRVYMDSQSKWNNINAAPCSDDAWKVILGYSHWLDIHSVDLPPGLTTTERTSGAVKVWRQSQRCKGGTTGQTATALELH